LEIAVSAPESLEEEDNRYWLDRVVVDPPTRAAAAYLIKFRLDVRIISN
jgi:hypothetical protein